MLGLFAGIPGGRAWRRALGGEGHRPGAGAEVIEEALALVPERAPPQDTRRGSAADAPGGPPGCRPPSAGISFHRLARPLRWRGGGCRGLIHPSTREQGAMARIGVDVGGTFTDLILESDGSAAGGGGGRVFVHKVPSTPEDQSRGVIRGVLEICAEAGVAPGDIEQIVHGTTIATNTVIEYSGAEVGMLTTRGFRDILHMARHKRPHNFSVQFDVPWQSRPLVKRRNRIPVTERILPPDGGVDTALDEDEVRAAAELLRSREVDAVIVCFLFAFLNDAHERRARRS